MQKHPPTKGTLSFLRAELETAMTFILVARQAKYEDRIVRNIANARKACEATRSSMERAQLSKHEAAEIGGKLATVQKELAALEDSVNRKAEQEAA